MPIAQSTVPSVTPYTPNFIHGVESHDASAGHHIVAPIYVLRDLAADAGAQSPQEVRTRHDMIGSGDETGDVISEGLLSLADAMELMQMCVSVKTNHHYARLHDRQFSRALWEMGQNRPAYPNRHRACRRPEIFSAALCMLFDSSSTYDPDSCSESRSAIV